MGDDAPLSSYLIIHLVFGFLSNLPSVASGTVLYCEAEDDSPVLK